MICPAPSKKPSSTHWLDRLRSARGFPTTGGVDIDRFISGQASDSSTAAPTHESKASPESTRPESTLSQLRTPTQLHAQTMITESSNARNDARFTDEEEEAGIGHVLCELFVMGGESRRKDGIFGNLAKKNKSARKQSNPRFCDVWSKGTINDNDYSCGDLSRWWIEKNKSRKNGLGSSEYSKNSSLSYRRKGSTMVPINTEEVGLRTDDKEKEEKRDRNSMSEVTVIDSSIEGWKVERYVFRKKTVWKVMEKRSKSRNFSGKRRKLVGANWGGRDDVDEDDEKKKKKKKKVLKVSDAGIGAKMLKDGKREQIGPMRIDTEHSWDDKLVKLPEEVASVPNQVPETRFTTSCSSQKFKSIVSSVILVRPIRSLDTTGMKKLGKPSRKAKHEFEAFEREHLDV